MTVLPLRVLGADLDLHLTGPDAEAAHARLVPLWSGCRREGPADSGVRHLTVHAGEPGADPVPHDAIVATVADRLPTGVSWSVTHVAIEAGVGRLLMLHAAGLADPASGATAVFVAPGGTGKTSLCRTLGPGRRYLTDETVGLGADGTVTAFAKPLSVRRPGQEMKDEHDPAALGLLTTGADPWLAGLVLLRRDPDHRGPARVEELDLLDAVVALCEETSSLDRLERPLHLVADLVAGSRPVVRATYAEAASLEPLLTEILGTGPR